MNIYEFVKEKRIENGKTQEEMAKALGYKSKSSYSQLENGLTVLSVVTLIEITKILELSSMDIENIMKIFLNNDVGETVEIACNGKIYAKEKEVPMWNKR